MASASSPDGSGGLPNSDERRVELTLDLWMNPDNFRNADGEVDEDLMYREALTYAAEAAEQDEFDVAVTRASKESEQSSEKGERETGTCPICESTARKMRNGPKFICNGCARYLKPEELRDS